MPTLACLVTVYHRINPAELRECLNSLAAQTRPADHTVIVADGPLPPSLDEVIADFTANTPSAEVVRLPENLGAGPAAQAGLGHIQETWLARLDADDVAAPTRFERQLSYLAAHPQIDVLGTSLAEFTHDTAHAQSTRSLPETHAEIARYTRWNSPVNNPSVVLRTEWVNKVGGYRDVHHMEDYDLFARLLAAGAQFYNLSEPLTFFRVDDAQFDRRTGRGMFAAELKMQRTLRRLGLISTPRMWFNVVVRSAYRALPRTLLRRIYAWLFHGARR